MVISGLWIKGASLLAIALSTLGQTGQSTDSLSDYLSGHGWDASKSGPMIVVDPDHVRAKHGAASLNLFDRKPASLGSITAIVPRDMVLIDDSLLQEPNLYDGLARTDKVLYLVSTLTPEQAKTGAAGGIGISDLQGEQVKVFKSILGPSLTYTTHIVDGDSTLGKQVDEQTLTGDQLDSVKLKLQSGLLFHLIIQENPRSYSVLSPHEWRGKPGDKTINLRDSGYRTNFGIEPRKSVPNELKPSQLNYRDPVLNTEVNLPAEATIKGVLQAVGSVTGMELLSDIRVSGLKVKCWGAKAKASDLLKGLALCVTGTYRKVGPSFVLTSEIAGMGVRKLKFAAWSATVNRELHRRQRLWHSQIGKSGALSKVGFDEKSPFAPNDRALLSLDTEELVPTADLTQPMRDLISHAAVQRRADPFDLHHVGIESVIEYVLVLPSGQQLSGESLGQRMSFRVPDAPKVEPEIKINPTAPGVTGRHRLIVRAESKHEAEMVLDAARRHGFKQVWLETHHKEAVSAAVKSGLKVSLVIRPWKALSGTSRNVQDLNILGDTGTQLAARRALEPDWQRAQSMGDASGLGPPPIYDLVDHLDPGVERRWTELASLARTPGLNGLVLIESRPLGYELTDSRISWGSFYENWLAVLNEFGYSESMRLSFLRAHGVDPIDVATPDIELNFDISQPFFIDGNLGHYDYRPGSPSLLMQPIPEQWCAYRSKINADAINRFTAMLSGITLPIYVQPRSSVIHVLPSLCLDVVPWTPDKPWPEVSPQKPLASTDRVGLYALYEESSLVAIRHLLEIMAYPEHVGAIDMSTVKAGQVESLLRKWFMNANTSD